MKYILLTTVSLLLKIHDRLYPTKIETVHHENEYEMVKDLEQEIVSGKKIHENDKYKVWLFVFTKHDQIYWKSLVGSEIDLIRTTNLLRINHKSLMYVNTDDLMNQILEGVEK